MSDTFKKELQALLNKHTRENVSNTPDFILANYMLRSLEAYEEAVGTREQWYGVQVKPGQLSMDVGFTIDLTKPSLSCEACEIESSDHLAVKHMLAHTCGKDGCATTQQD